MDDGEQHHGNAPTGSRGDGSTLDAQLWEPPMSEYEGVVAQDVDDVDNTCNHHRIDDLVGTAQRGRERQ